MLLSNKISTMENVQYNRSNHNTYRIGNEIKRITTKRDNIAWGQQQLTLWGQSERGQQRQSIHPSESSCLISVHISPRRSFCRETAPGCCRTWRRCPAKFGENHSVLEKRALRTHVEGDQLAKCGELRLSFDVDVQIASACVQDSDVAVKVGGLLQIAARFHHFNSPKRSSACPEHDAQWKRTLQAILGQPISDAVVEPEHACLLALLLRNRRCAWAQVEFGESLLWIVPVAHLKCCQCSRLRAAK